MGTSQATTASAEMVGAGRPSRPLIIGWEPTPAGVDAVALGRALAQALGVPPLLAHVVALPPHLLTSAEIERGTRKEAEAMLADPREQLADLDPTTEVVVEPSVARALQELARQREASCIVLGASHRSAAGRLLLGNVGVSLLHGAPCPVAVAPRGWEGELEGATVGVAFDGSAEAFAALEAAVAIAQRASAELTILTIAEPPVMGVATTYAVLSAADWYGSARAEAERIGEIAAGHVGTRAPHRVSVRAGAVVQILREASAEVDIMLIGSRAYGSIGRTLLGSTAAGLLTQAACPVLVIPRGAGTNAFHLIPGRAERARESAA